MKVIFEGSLDSITWQGKVHAEFWAHGKRIGTLQRVVSKREHAVEILQDIINLLTPIEEDTQNGESISSHRLVQGDLPGIP